MWFIPAIFLSIFLIFVLIGWLSLDVDDMMEDYEEEFGVFRDEIFALKRKLELESERELSYLLYLACIVAVMAMFAVVYFVITRPVGCSIT
jgi:hypothetical protein